MESLMVDKGRRRLMKIMKGAKDIFYTYPRGIYRSYPPRDFLIKTKNIWSIQSIETGGKNGFTQGRSHNSPLESLIRETSRRFARWVGSCVTSLWGLDPREVWESSLALDYFFDRWSRINVALTLGLPNWRWEISLSFLHYLGSK